LTGIRHGQEILTQSKEIVGENRWDEKAGLRRDAVRSQVIDVLEAQIKRRPAMKKISTAAGKQIRNISEQKLTIGLDLGDRSSGYCLLDEVGEVLLEQKLGTTPKAMREVFGTCRAAASPCKRGIERLAQESYPQVARLKQVKGVGTLIALTFLPTLEDAHRFRKSRDVGCYLGLQPGRRNSGQSEPQMHISKEGDPYLRTLLVQGAHHIPAKANGRYHGASGYTNIGAPLTPLADSDSFQYPIPFGGGPTYYPMTGRCSSIAQVRTELSPSLLAFV
jgi:hypothetical protein